VIERRSADEIDDTLSIYKAMFDIKKQHDRSLERLKRIEKTNTLMPSTTNDI